MRLRICTMTDFESRIKDKELVCFGAGAWACDTARIFPDFGFYNHISYFVDNDAAVHNSIKIINDKEIPIKPPDYLYQNANTDTVILLTINTKNALKVLNQLNERRELRCIDVYMGNLIVARDDIVKAYSATAASADFRMNLECVIPKKLHYCWVGGNEIPLRNRKWMESWRKFCPDYEIIEWNESNYDFFKHPYMKDAYENKMWGFVPDYARLDIIYEHGGVYLDTDVEIVRPLDDLLYNSAFMGFMSAGCVALGLGFGAAAGHPLIGDLRDSYDGIDFDCLVKTADRKTAPALNTQYLLSRGLKPNGCFQIIAGCAFMPVTYFNPYERFSEKLLITESTYSIHHYDGSWVDEERKDIDMRFFEIYRQAIASEEELHNREAAPE